MNRIRSKYGIMTATLLLTALATACGRQDTAGQVSTDDEALISIGDSTLYLRDVVSRIPVGVEESDSIALFNSIVDSWIENQLLIEMAEKDLGDISRINRMAEDYRRQLIISEYMQRMKMSHTSEVKDSEVQAYYNEHQTDFTLDYPLIRGVYLKVADNVAADGKIQKLLSNPSRQNIDKLEKDVTKVALQYEYFIDKWVEWEKIADQIPYRFFDPDAFVESSKDFSTSYNGSTYFLHISESIPSGDVMPYEVAAPKIREALERNNSDDYERRFINGLYKRALKDGKLKKISYDPIARQRIGKQKAGQ